MRWRGGIVGAEGGLGLADSLSCCKVIWCAESEASSAEAKVASVLQDGFEFLVHPESGLH